MVTLTFFIIVFIGIGAFFLFIHLMMGKLIRPNRPEPDKLTIYECGEPTVGSAWVQFDLRYYVVALLFVIFDVEVAFFFPWAVVFGNANALSRPDLDANPNLPVRRQALTKQLRPAGLPSVEGVSARIIDKKGLDEETAHSFAVLAFCDILVFFGVLMVGFAYLWRRGDINWVRSTTAERDLEQPLETLPAREHAVSSF